MTISPQDLEREDEARRQMDSWLGPEYKSDLENLVARQRAENPHQVTREMLMLKKIHNAEVEQRKLADQADGITRNAQGQSVIPRADELEMKWRRHTSHSLDDVDYQMTPAELTEYQIMLQKAQGGGPLTRDARIEAALTAAENGDMDEYRRLRRESR